MLTSSMDNEATMKWNSLSKSPKGLLLSNPTSKNTNGKNNLPALSIYIVFGIFKYAL